MLAAYFPLVWSHVFISSGNDTHCPCLQWFTLVVFHFFFLGSWSKFVFVLSLGLSIFNWIRGKLLNSNEFLTLSLVLRYAQHHIFGWMPMIRRRPQNSSEHRIESSWKESLQALVPFFSPPVQLNWVSSKTIVAKCLFNYKDQTTMEKSIVDMDHWPRWLKWTCDTDHNIRSLDWDHMISYGIRTFPGLNYQA